MNNLLFLMRVSFICNVCLLVAWLGRHFHFLADNSFSSTVIVLGVVVSSFLNLSIHIALLALQLTGRFPKQFFPPWLLIINFLFLLFQLILFFK